jgi:hypothetical protein
MCYTEQTSINAFLIGTISSIVLLLYTNDKRYEILALFFLFVTLMQLYDYIFWTNKNNKVNEITTKIATITNHLQPIILALIILYFYKTLKFESKWLTILYTIIILIYTLNGWNTLKYTEVTPKSAPSLEWKWNHFSGSVYVYILFLILLNVLFIQAIGGTLGYISAILTTFSFVFSLWKYQKQLSTGRFWCYFASLVPIILLIFNYFKL